jgi:predicted Na+-dependent transporter
MMEATPVNRQIPRIGAAIVCATVFLFAVFLVADYSFGYYFVCMLLPLGYIMMAAGLQREAEEDRKVAANVGLVFSTVYATLILLVYFAQTTSVRLDGLGDDALRVLDFGRGGLLFNYDMLGYGMMALSTFFLGLSMRVENRADRWLKRLLILHGVFFISCFILPMTGMFSGMADGEDSNGGMIALVAWCAYFLPVGLLAWWHFR